MRDHFRALKWGFFGATFGPILFICVGYLLAAMGVAVAIGCVIGFPVAAIFFPKKLLAVVTPTAGDRETARRIDERMRLRL